MTKQTQLLVAGGAAAAAAAGAGVYLYSARNASNTEYVVFFRDGDLKSGHRLPRTNSLSELRTQIEEALHIDDAGLYLMQADGKRLLTSSEQLAAAYADASLCIQGALLLLVTPDAAPLSEASLAAAPLAPVPTGPVALPKLGNLLCYLTGDSALPYNLAANVFSPERQAQWGDTVVLHLPGSGGGADTMDEALPGLLDYAVTTCDPEVVAELLERQDTFPKLWSREVVERKLADFAGNGLFTSSTRDHDWENAHGLLPRAFNQIRIKNYFPVMLAKTRSFVVAWYGFSNGKLLSDVNDWLTCMTADAVVKASMGVDMGNVEAKAKGEPLHRFIEAFRYGLKAAIGRATVKSEFGTLAAWNPFFNGKAALKAKADAAHKVSHDVVNEMLEKTRRGEIGGPGSVLTAMLSDVSPSTGEYVRLCNIYGQVMNLMIAGHETTAATLGWTLFYISTHPEVEAKALAEIEAVLGERYQPTVDDVPKLVYLEACFREALRLHPAVGTVTRDVAHDTTLKGKWLVRKGQRIDINNVALQRREDQYGGKFGDPNKFNPERFMPGAAEETGRHPNSWNPWGFGIRACIGSQFALWESKIFLSMILRFYKLRAPDGFKPKPSTADGGAAPTPHHLAFYISRRKGVDSALEGISKSLSSADLDDAPAAAAGAPVATKAVGGVAPSAAAGAGDSHGTPLLVLYGSNMGTCEELAATVAGKATAAGFASKTATLNAAVKALAAGQLKLEGPVLIVSSTYNGTPPDNANEFAKWLAAQPAGSLSKVTYAVYGVGNSQWQQTFQAFPKQVALQMEAAGAHQVLEFASSDVDANDWMEAFDAWQSEVMRAMIVNFNLTPPDSYAAQVGGEAGSARRRLHLRLMDASEPGAATTPEQVIASINERAPADDNTHVLEVLENRELQGPGAARSTRHVQLALPAGAAGEYQAGDHLEVLAVNSEALVGQALKLLGLSGDERVEWKTNLSEDDGAARSLGGGDMLTYVVDLRTALSYLVDLAAVPGRRAVAALADACPCPPEAAKLKEMATEEGYKALVLGKKLSLVELLLQYRSVPVDLPQLANLLPRMSPRYYSISSSPLARPGTCSISVGVVGYTTPTGRVHKGAASAHIAATPVGGKLLGSVRHLSSTFRLPKDPSVPVIMVGPGTGVAPMMGFLQERAVLAAQGLALGPAHLFFGCRSAKEDFIYRQELESYKATGVLAGLHVAFSRDGPSKVYVQDLILEKGKELWQLFEAGANVYICGDARRMAPDVRTAFKEVARTWGGKTDAAVEAWMGSLLERKAYHEDVWAG